MDTSEAGENWIPHEVNARCNITSSPMSPLGYDLANHFFMYNTVNNLGFMGQVVSVTPTQVCYCSEKVAEEKYLSERTWLCSSKDLFMETEI